MWTYIDLEQRKERKSHMSDYTGVLWIAGILGITLIMGMIKSKAEWIINLILRGVAGMLGIYFVNMLVAGSLPEISLGYNGITFLISGILGMPGVLLMYGLGLYLQYF